MTKKKVEETEVKVNKRKKNKVKDKTSDKRETVLIANSEEEAQELINRITNAEIVETKEEKKRNFWSEVKAFFGILLIIGLIVLIGFIVFKYVEPLEKDKGNKEETKIVETSEYKTVSYVAEDKRKLEVLDNKYVIETKDTVLYKVLDMDSNVLFEGTEKYSSIYVGVDGELYVFCYGYLIGATYDVALYRIEDKELVEVVVLDGDHDSHTEILYTDKKGNNKIIGVLGEKYSSGSDDIFSIKSTIYKLDGSKEEVEDVRVNGDTVRNSDDLPVYSYSSDYVVVYDYKNDYKAGVYDLKNNELVVSTKYDGLYTTYDGNYIAIKNKKAGIVNLKSKILVDFDYDFISDNNGFYVISKDNKLGIINSKYEEVIKPTFTFQEANKYGFSYEWCCGAVNSFAAHKYNDKYILTIDNEELYYNLDYKLHETYVINESGEYMTIEANEFGVYEDFLYSYDKKNKKYIVYDQTFAEKYTIDLSGYDLDGNPVLSYINGNTLVITMGSTLYFDALNGDELESVKDATLVDDKIELKYSSSNNSVSLKVDGKVISTYDYDEESQNNFYIKVKDGMYYYVGDNTFIMVRKSE